MTNESNNQTEILRRLLRIAQESYRAYQRSGSRSTEKTKILHGWIIRELRMILGQEYQVNGLTADGSSKGEVTVQGKYYEKRVDVAISREKINLGVVSVKFVMSNYRQNKNNYFENQLGETANLRSNDIVFGHIMMMTEPLPYFDKRGKIKRMERVKDDVFELYLKLIKDHQQPHVPDVQCLVSFKLEKIDPKTWGITEFSQKSDFVDISNESFEAISVGGRLSIGIFFERMKKELDAKWLKLKNT